MGRTVISPIAALWLSLQLGFGSGAPIVPTGGCETTAAVSVAVGSGKTPSNGQKVLDSDRRTKWVSHGKGESLWLELATPTVIESVAVAFRKGNKRVHTFSIFLVTKENKVELVYEGKSSGKTKNFQIFSLGDKAQEAEAVTIVGYGNNKNKWNGYAEVELCAFVAPEKVSEVEPGTTLTTTLDTELPFPEGRKGFNIVNGCTFPIRVGSTGNRATCSAGTATNPKNGACFWALPEGERDLAPGQAAQYVLPELGSKTGSLIWAGNIWVSTGCTSEISGDNEHPSTDTCVTNFCPDGGYCPDYFGPSGTTTKAEFALQEGGLDFYDVSIIDGANVPMEIVPINPVFNTNDHYCGRPGNTEASGDMEACSWEFFPKAVEGHADVDLSPYTRVVWPSDPDNPVSCLVDSQCENTDGSDQVCGAYEERTKNGDSTTGSIIPNVCGRVVGWIGAHSACGATQKDGETFPDGFPYNCQRAARHGTLSQLYRCSGSVYGSQACYLVGAEDSCCGCPSWDSENGGCISTNPDWTQAALPWASFFKTACPTAYSFPRDDRTSMFVCSNEDADIVTGKNTQSYSIRLCPGDSEENFYK